MQPWIPFLDYYASIQRVMELMAIVQIEEGMSKVIEVNRFPDYP